jgi:phosphatidylinositol glycan class N
MKENLGLIATWVMSCMAMSVFTLLPANKMEDLNMM